MVYFQEAHPVRLRTVHVINCSPMLDRIMTVLRPFMKKEVSKLVNYTPLYSTIFVTIFFKKSDSHLV